jgi:hypothetical protein
MDGSLKVYYCVSDVLIINLSCTCTENQRPNDFLFLLSNLTSFFTITNHVNRFFADTKKYITSAVYSYDRSRYFAYTNGNFSIVEIDNDSRKN